VALALGQAGKLQPMAAHVFDMFGPRVDQGDIVARSHHVPAGVSADRARSHHYDSFSQSKLPKSKA
jgi:hypothetical protein